MQFPISDQSGSFAKTLAPAPETWPWALPHYYAINTVSDPGEIVVGWVASPNGTQQSRQAFSADRSRVETIGLWHASFAILETVQFAHRSEAEHYASEVFQAIPTKFMMHDGQIIADSKIVELTGDWPRTWHFSQIRDLGVFLCYLVLRARAASKTKEANRLQETLQFAWPPTELLANYRRALQTARNELHSILDGETQLALKQATQFTEQLLKGDAVRKPYFPNA
ncbi:MAG: hypothetical protein HZB51_32125 [Chloroflexi bacterium]|nr:hypothetical protein [Chloroflexota bacterium]